jgi:flagellar protein FliO/FliZ
MKGRHLRIIDSISLGFDKQIYLLKAGEQILLVSSSNKNIRFLTLLDNGLAKISEDELNQIQDVSSGNIEGIFKNYLDIFRNSNKKSNNMQNDNDNTANENRFNNNLNKMKNIFSKFNSEKNGDEKSNE